MAHRIAAIPYNLSRIFEQRDKLLNETLTEFLGTELDGEWFDKFVDTLCDALQLTEPVVFDSVRYLAGTVLIRPAAYTLAWQLAGNIRKLRDGIPVTRWFAQVEEEWLPIQILSWEPTKSARGNSVNTYTMRVLAGSACTVRTS